MVIVGTNAARGKVLARRTGRPDMCAASGSCRPRAPPRAQLAGL